MQYFFLANVVEVVAACHKHSLLQLFIENPQHVFDTLLAFARKRPEDGSADPNGVSTESQCLDYVIAATDSTVKQDRQLLTCFLLDSVHLFTDFRKNFNRRWRGIKLSGAMIADIDAISAAFESEAYVLAAHNALAENG